MPDFDETKQRINRVNAEIGGLVLMPDQWGDVDALSDALEIARPALPHDGDQVAQRIAGYLVKEHVDTDRPRSVCDRWMPDHDEADPAGLSNLYVLTHTNTDHVIPLRTVNQLKEVAKVLRHSHCEARVTRHCEPRNATKFLAVSRGEYICLFNTCRPCLQHIASRSGFNDDYNGPTHDWVDDRRSAEPDPDPWAL